MKMQKYYITIEETRPSFGVSYKVELEDHYGNRTTVYERTIEEAVIYARNWCRRAEERHIEVETHSKAVAQCIKLDEKAGITSRYRDCLD
mgnify:CR=1 FL=1